jgi:hypothetical protein
MKQTQFLLATISALIVALPVSAKISATVDLPAEAKRGESVTVSVKTEPKLKCKIQAQDAGLTQVLKLTDQDSDSTGNASWKFDVPKDYKADELPVIVTVSKDKEEEKVTRSIKVNK